MDELQSAVTEVHVIGERYLQVKEQIAECIARQKSNREAITAINDTKQNNIWLERPGGIYLQLQIEQCAKLLLADQQQLATRLEDLFSDQRHLLAELEEKGVGPDYITSTAHSRHTRT